MNMHQWLARAGVLAAATALLSGMALAQSPTSSLRTATSEDIRDIRGPKPLASAWLTPLIMAGVVAGFGAGWAIWARRRRHQLAKKSPRELALARLEAARALIGEGNSRSYSIELSNIVRQYLEDAFQLIATHLTTDEFLRAVAEAPDFQLSKSREQLSDFLRSCDLAKFGGWSLSAAGMQDMWESARRFVAESPDGRSAASQTHPVESNDPRETYDSLPST